MLNIPGKPQEGRARLDKALLILFIIQVKEGVM